MADKKATARKPSEPTASKEMTLDHITEQASRELTRHTVGRAEQDLYIAELALARGSATKATVEEQRELVKAYTAQAKAEGVEGPYCPAAAIRQTLDTNVEQVEREYKAAKFREAAGTADKPIIVAGGAAGSSQLAPEVTSEDLVKAKEAMLKIKPPGVREDDPVNGPPGRTGIL